MANSPCRTVHEDFPFAIGVTVRRCTASVVSCFSLYSPPPWLSWPSPRPPRVNCAVVRTHFPECVRVVVVLLLLRYLGDRESLHLSVQAFFASLCTWMMQNEAWAFFLAKGGNYESPLAFYVVGSAIKLVSSSES